MKQLVSKVSRRIWLLQLALSSLIICLCFRFTRAQEGFVSIDCGASKTYTDSNGLEWTSDDTMVYTGNKSLVTPPTNAGAPAQFSTIRYFPGDQSKYCYVFNNRDHGVVQGDAYLVRASFWAGSVLPYETQVNNTVKFKLLLYADVWDDVLITLPQTSVVMFKEIYVVAMNDTIDVCLAGKDMGMDIPFISSLVLRPLSPNITSVDMMIHQQAKRRPFSYMYRINYGALSANSIVSYNEDGSGDPFDREWQPNTTNSISTTLSVATDVFDQLPLKVMQTAYQNDDSFDLTFPLPSGYFYHYSLFFAELSPNVTLPGQRVFKLQIVSGTGSIFGWATIDLMKIGNSSHYLDHMDYSQVPVYVGIEGSITFSLIKQNGSTYGPIICGLELLQVSNHDMPLGADTDEVATLRSIITAYPSLNSSSGDPCLPYAYNWLTCTNDIRPLISTISLTNKSLSGEILTNFNDFTSLVQLSLADNALSGMIPDLGSLKNLEVLDLHGNNLSGPIPEYLGDLFILETLNLANNNLSGEIPSNLLAKASSNSLNFSIAGNPSLCGQKCYEEYCSASTINGEQTKNTKGNSGLVVGLAIAGVIAALIAIGLLILCIAKQKRKTSKQAEIDQGNDHEENVLPLVNVLGRSIQGHEFTFQAIKKMTRNFEKILGQGGFGPVYYGVLDNGREVAIKRLARDSRQGERKFLNEVDLLSRVHHKTLVNLVGYCIENELILVYDFMANGSLCEALRGKESKLVSWKDRLVIAVDAAEGLDYLHRGCHPSIIHRDVKSSNILLNGQFEGKISDFGISKAKHYTNTVEEGPQTITVVQGSFGYLDPVYAETNVANHSIDVYAFGVVLFEMITGKSPLIQQRPGDEELQHILEWAKPLIEQGNLLQLVDPRLYQDYNVSSMWKVIDVAMMCVEKNRRKRPNMSEVMYELKSALSMELQNDMHDIDLSKDMITPFPYTMDVHTR